jgi:hypothetical protein
MTVIEVTYIEGGLPILINDQLFTFLCFVTGKLLVTNISAERGTFGLFCQRFILGTPHPVQQSRIKVSLKQKQFKTGLMRTLAIYRVCHGFRLMN